MSTDRREAPILRLRARFGAATSPEQDAVAGLSPDWQEWFEERAAIREYDGGHTRPEAERLARGETLAAMKRGQSC
jgi:hypothetical protein